MGELSALPEKVWSEIPDGAVLFRSSGTSGVEKWIVHTRGSLLASACAVNAHLGMTEQDILGLLLPLVHVGGFGILARAYEASASVAVYEGKWDARNAVDFLSEERVSVTSLVPTQVYDLVNKGLRAPDGLRAVIVGGGRLEKDVGKAARNLGWPVLQSYGMTEAGSQIATQAVVELEFPFSPEILSVLPCWDLSLSEGGALKVSGDPLCHGLLKRAGEEWFYEEISQPWSTNDRVELQGETLCFLGRIDRVIKVKGELVDLDGIEETFRVKVSAEVVVIPVADARDGQALRVFSTRALGDEELRAVIPSFVKIHHFQVLSEIPKTPLGKIDRRRILQR